MRHLDRRIAKATSDIEAAVVGSGSSLTELCGIGTLTAGKILARVGSIHRFRSAAAFTSDTGTAPIEASSGDVVRHRLSRAGDRQLNCCLHTMAITQISRDTPGRAYYQRKRALERVARERCAACGGGSRTSSTSSSSSSSSSLLRGGACGGSGRTLKGDSHVLRGRLTPRTCASDRSLPEPTTGHCTTAADSAT
ncbi:transposase [Rhodococcus wratislaviensis]|uniref:transposase n=1 Tax=Rhodococcus wratislaviensis TaxID=44752 RepID=UPI003649794A